MLAFKMRFPFCLKAALLGVKLVLEVPLLDVRLFYHCTTSNQAGYKHNKESVEFRAKLCIPIV